MKPENNIIDHFNNSLDSFLNDNKQKVFVIKGDWGVGKTYYWKKHYLESRRLQLLNKEENNPLSNFYGYSYISLFGLSSLKEISENVLLNSETLNKSKGENFNIVKTIKSFKISQYCCATYICFQKSTFLQIINPLLLPFKGISFIGRKTIEKIQKTFSYINSYLRNNAPEAFPKYEKKHFIHTITKNFYPLTKKGWLVSHIGDFSNSILNRFIFNHVICIDDIERKNGNLSITELFGYIDEITSGQKNCKVILILNETEIKNELDKNAYKNFREKIISVEKAFTPNTKDLLNIVFDDIQILDRFPIITNSFIKKNPREDVYPTNIRVLNKLKDNIYYFSHFYDEILITSNDFKKLNIDNKYPIFLDELINNVIHHTIRFYLTNEGKASEIRNADEIYLAIVSYISNGYLLPIEQENLKKHFIYKIQEEERTNKIQTENHNIKSLEDNFYNFWSRYVSSLNLTKNEISLNKLQDLITQVLYLPKHQDLFFKHFIWSIDLFHRTSFMTPSEIENLTINYLKNTNEILNTYNIKDTFKNTKFESIFYDKNPYANKVSPSLINILIKKINLNNKKAIINNNKNLKFSKPPTLFEIIDLNDNEKETTKLLIKHLKNITCIQLAREIINHAPRSNIMSDINIIYIYLKEFSTTDPSSLDKFTGALVYIRDNSDPMNKIRIEGFFQNLKI